MHPILARRGRLLRLLIAAMPLAALLTGILARPGAFTLAEGVSLALPLAFVSLFLFLSVWYTCRAAPLRGPSVLRTAVTHGAAAVLTSAVWVMGAPARRAF